jgi:CRISPR-associated endonuclease/helicase Cas3
MTFTYWAKKPLKGAAPTVTEHTDDVCEAAMTVWLCTASDLNQAVGTTEELASLESLLHAAARLHDVAKVNSAFQQMLRASPGDPQRQPVRHEILAAWLLSDSCVCGNWFLDLRTPEEIWPILWAVAGHHLKMGDPKHAGTPGQPPALFSLANAPDVVTIPLCEIETMLAASAKALGAPQPVPTLGKLQFRTSDSSEQGLEERIGLFAAKSYTAWEKLKRTPGVKPRTALLKAFLIASDVAASALTREGERAATWVPKALGRRIEQPTLEPVIANGLKGKRPLAFQQQVEQSGPAAVVIAGCGNGKTTAAYMWARRHAVGKKLWFTYPTTGTASAGFEDYVFRQPELEGVLIHGRARVDLQAMQGTPEDDRGEEALRLESLEAWKSQVVVCTVDTVLGLLQNQRRPLFSFPAIIVGAVVFDEVHSYDPRMFGALLRFLKSFPGLPVLIMSASIPPTRLEAIRAALGDRSATPVRGDENLEGRKRYRLTPRASSEGCRADVKQALGEGKKVLWVCNTVADAIRTAREARDWAGVEPIIYHSRFRYQDRVNRQKALISAFRSSQQALAVTTQVCEMSLDISANLLVTAECPLPSLVQRLGRLNRYAAADDPWPCLVYPFCGAPYNEDPKYAPTRGDYRADMAATRSAVAELAGRPCSQQDLAARLDSLFVAEQFEEGAAWLDAGWVTVPAPVRESDASITVIREEDLADIEKALGQEHSKPSKWTFLALVPWSIPMNSPGRLKTNRLPAGGYPVAAEGTISYCEKEGAIWQTKMN